jgi:hypothetical protein
MTPRGRFFEAFASRPRPSAMQTLRSTVGPSGDRLRALLATRTAEELSAPDLRSEVEGNLWMLSAEAFRYFLPAFLHAALDSYSSVSVFVSELIGALTAPSRESVSGAIDRLGQALPEIGLPKDTANVLRKQQLEWFDSGTPAAAFHDRLEGLTATEGAAVLDFLQAFQQAHGQDFPFDELQTAVERYWSRFRQ